MRLLPFGLPGPNPIVAVLCAVPAHQQAGGRNVPLLPQGLLPRRGMAGSLGGQDFAAEKVVGMAVQKRQQLDHRRDGFPVGTKIQPQEAVVVEGVCRLPVKQLHRADGFLTMQDCPAHEIAVRVGIQPEVHRLQHALQGGVMEIVPMAVVTVEHRHGLPVAVHLQQRGASARSGRRRVKCSLCSTGQAS